MTKIKYAALYYDGQLLSPERMTVEIILDGEDEGNHAKALNYTFHSNLLKMAKQLFRDEITGNEILVNPKLIINAAGPWIDDVNNRIGFQGKTYWWNKGISPGAEE